MIGDVSTSRLGTITAQDLQRVFDQHELGQITAMQPATGGSFGQVLVVESSSGGWIFKGAPLVEEQFYAERFYTALLHEHTRLPVPWPYIHDTTCAVFPWDFALMPKLDGVDLGQPDVWARLSADDQHDLAVEMGRTLATVATVSNDVPGTYDHATGRIQPFPQGYANGILTEVHALIRSIRDVAPASLPDRDVAWIETGISALLTHTIATSSPSLTMQDFKDQNMMGRRSDSGWCISGLFDLGGLHFGDPAMGFCRQLAQFRSYENGDVMARAFVASAKEHGINPSHLTARVRGFALHERLSIWEWATREGRTFITGGAASFGEWAKPMIRFAMDAVSGYGDSGSLSDTP
jgi:aminoglycoside phosphotransferase (APT) family kinase protein